MITLFFTVREWNRFTSSIQENLCQKYNVILTDHQTRKEKITSLLDKINMKNFNKGINAFNKSLNQFSKTVDSLTVNKSDCNQDKNIDESFGRTRFSKDAILGKSVRLTGPPVSIWPEKQSQKDQKTDTGIW